MNTGRWFNFALARRPAQRELGGAMTGQWSPREVVIRHAVRRQGVHRGWCLPHSSLPVRSDPTGHACFGARLVSTMNDLGRRDGGPFT